MAGLAAVGLLLVLLPFLLSAVKSSRGWANLGMATVTGDYENAAPARVFVFSIPKTGSAAALYGMKAWFRENGKDPENVVRCHNPFRFRYCPEAQNLTTCTPSNWCLIASGVRRLAPQLLAAYCQHRCGPGVNTESCQAVMKMNSTRLHKSIVQEAEQKLIGGVGANPADWWSHTKLVLHKFGLRLSLNELIRDGVAKSPNAVWVTLPMFEEVSETGIQLREAKMSKWLPGVTLKDSRPHARPFYEKQYGAMKSELKRLKGKFWPPSVRDAILNSDTMIFFYNTSGAY